MMPPIGMPLDRVDGRRKVTGGARYAAEHNLEKGVRRARDEHHTLGDDSVDRHQRGKEIARCAGGPVAPEMLRSSMDHSRRVPVDRSTISPSRASSLRGRNDSVRRPADRGRRRRYARTRHAWRRAGQGDLCRGAGANGSAEAARRGVRSREEQIRKRECRRRVRIGAGEDRSDLSNAARASQSDGSAFDRRGMERRSPHALRFVAEHLRRTEDDVHALRHSEENVHMSRSLSAVRSAARDRRGRMSRSERWRRARWGAR